MGSGRGGLGDSNVVGMVCGLRGVLPNACILFQVWYLKVGGPVCGVWGLGSFGV